MVEICIGVKATSLKVTVPVIDTWFPFAIEYLNNSIQFFRDENKNPVGLFIKNMSWDDENKKLNKEIIALNGGEKNKKIHYVLKLYSLLKLL